jgi:hypothetical protein
VLVFNDTKCLILEIKEEKIVQGVWDSSNELHWFHIHEPKFQVCAIECPNTSTLWQKWFNHFNHHSLRFLVANHLVKNISLIPMNVTLYQHCMESKQSHEQAYKKSECQVSQPLEFIHSDLCGMIKPTSMGGVHYFMTIINDYSRYTCVYFLKFNSQAL